MIIVEGVNVFPTQIEAALLEAEGVEPHYRIILDREEGLDSMEIQVEISNAIPNLDETGVILRFKTNIEKRLAKNLGFSPKATLIEPKSLERSDGGKMKYKLMGKRGIP